MKRLILYVLFILTVPVVSFASGMGSGGFTGNELLSDCDLIKGEFQKSAIDTGKVGKCIGAITAVWEAGRLYMWKLQDIEVTPYFCPPENIGIPPRQLHMIVDKYMRENPENLHFPAGFLIMESYRNAYPCPDK